MEWRERLGVYLVDVSKYVITGVVIASLFEDLENNKIVIYSVGIGSALSLLLVGLILSNKKETTKKDKKK